ncbi:MAG TPA: hypothetical protein VNA17_08140 [Pyrinomonadaceae bacterium]|nr:hypothetical protein [Pyrinomonadaceae bacterium]
MADEYLDNNGAREECTDVNRETARAGDAYYRAMTDWLIRRKRPPEDRNRILGLGRLYDRALDALIRCLERVRRGNPGAERKRKDAVDLRAYLHKDLETLTSSGTGLVSQPDEG